MWYKNCGRSTRVFHGVEFKPGKIANVNGAIVDPNFIAVDAPVVKSKPKIEAVKPTVKSNRGRKPASQKAQTQPEVTPVKAEGHQSTGDTIDKDEKEKE